MNIIPIPVASEEAKRHNWFTNYEFLLKQLAALETKCVDELISLEHLDATIQFLAENDHVKME